ncbi:MAG: MFS transporter [Quisquiliibacterium sp.]
MGTAEPDRIVQAGAQSAEPSVFAPLAPLTALGLTFSVQTLAALALSLPAVLAPVAAPALGLPAERVGWLVSATYLVAMLAGLNGGYLASRRGAVLVSQWALISSAVGIALLSSGWVPLLLLAAIAIGVGYGFTNPAAADILTRHVPVARRGLFFSIKQTGVPAGVALCGLVLPALLLLLPWQGATLAIALPLACVGGALTLWRSRLEPQLASRPVIAQAPGLVALFQSRVWLPLASVLGYPPTRRLALTSLVYALTQVSFLTFLVSYLKFDHDYPLALAAGLLSASQVVSVIGRVFWGYVSDRWVDPTLLLGILGLLMGSGIMLLWLIPAEAGWPVMLAVTLFCAATVVAWNGVFFADLVRQVEPHEVAQATGATQFMTFTGGMLGSGVFALLVSAAGSYAPVFGLTALLPATTGLLMLIAARGGLRQQSG